MPKPKLEYLHGFTKTEQDRLYRQARFLEPYVFGDIELKGAQNLLEIGCGVGAQTEILLERFPHLHITGIDLSKAQLKRARQHLSKALKDSRLELIEASASKMPFESNSFDAAFSTWLLEHVQEPIKILSEARRVLKAGGIIYLHEVLNATLYLHPYSPATLKYWFEFNDHQWNIKGDPFVGAKLGNYLQSAGFQNIETWTVPYHFDNRSSKKRSEFFEVWTHLLLSGAPNLIKAKKVSNRLVDQMKAELNLLKETSDSVFFYTSIRARAQAF